MRDYALGTTFDLKFTTRSFTTGAPTTLAGTPVISAYLDNNTTELTAGITLTVDFDGRTGLHNVRVVATSGNGYATATNYALVITTGTVGGVSVVGEVIGEFSLEAQSPLRPTIGGRTLDVTATGGAGIDWANVEAPTTTLVLTGTTIAVTQKVDVDTIKTNPVVNGGTITFPTTATLASTTNITAGTITTVSGNVNGSVGSVTGAVGSVTGLTASDVGAIKAKTDNLPAAPASTTNITAGTITTTTNLTNLPSIPANWLTAAGTAADFGAEVADALLDRDMSTGVDSGSTTVRTPRQALRAIRNKTDISAGTLTVKKEDDSTTSWTAAVSTDAAAVPIIGIDPAGP